MRHARIIKVKTKQMETLTSCQTCFISVLRVWAKTVHKCERLLGTEFPSYRPDSVITPLLVL